MTQPKRTPKPTDAELEILRVLWERGPSTVRDVQEALSRGKPTGYTTALKLMQIMAEKGLLRRDMSNRAHVYHPRIERERTLGQLTRDLIERAFGGSAERLVMQALRSKHITAKELNRIREVVDNVERGEE